MTQIVSKPDWGVEINSSVGQGRGVSRVYQDFFDDIERALNGDLLGQQVQLTEYLVADLPDAKIKRAGMIYVIDESGGGVPAFTDGVNWRRCTDRAIVS